MTLPVDKVRMSVKEAKIAEGHRVMRELESLCREAGVGARLPRHTELMRRIGASERAVMRSLEQLQRDGRIERRHGSGTYVLDAAPANLGANDDFDSKQIETKSVVVIARPDHGVFDRCLEILYDKAATADLDVVCRLLGSERQSTLVPESLGKPRGFILFRRDLAPLAVQLQDLGHRVVIVGAPEIGENFGVPAVYGHHELGGYLITRHLIDIGHRNIAYAHFSGSIRSNLRWRGHEKALRESSRKGVEVACSMIGTEQLELWRSNPRSAAEFFAQPESPTAIGVWNDSEAIQLVGTLSAAGISIPGRVSVTGYDNLIEGTWLHPPLTTVDHLLDQQIAAALDIIVSDDPPSPTDRMVFAPTLIVRESTASPGATISS